MLKRKAKRSGARPARKSPTKKSPPARKPALKKPAPGRSGGRQAGKALKSGRVPAAADAHPRQKKPGHSAGVPAGAAAAQTGAAGPAPAGAPAEGAGLITRVDLNETMKALVHLAHENGYLTYDDINDLLPEGLSPEELDEVLTKLRGMDIEIMDQSEVERNKPQQEQPEEEEDARLDILDDPVRMYMNQMGKVPLLTR
jgi:RNA polymerase primary sigma factor